jgi:alpha-galactosidase
MREKLVLVGAGSASFTRGLVSDIVRLGEEVELALVDTSADALAVAEGLAKKMVEATGAPVRLQASTDRREVLPGATAVICTVGVGGRRAWEQDVFIPRKYGIYQPVGDSVMPGGTSRALRMIPAMVDIAKDVLELAPQALFFNYGNPMPPVCRAIRKATGAKVVGLCHGVFHVGDWLAEVLGVERRRLKYTAAGVNHLTWFVEVRVDGMDALPRLQQVATRELAELSHRDSIGVRFPEAGEGAGDDLNPFSWQLLQRFNAYPACRDRHVSEFFPWLFAGKGSYYGRTLGVDSYSFERTISWGDQGFAQMREIALSKDPLPAGYFDRTGGEHEQVIDIIDSIRTDAGRVYSANLPNQGQVSNLPLEAVVESPAVATGGGVKAIAQRPLPSGIAGTLATRLAWVETVVEAALEGSRQKFVQALILDGAVTSVEMAEQMADEMLAAHAEYLPLFAANAPKRT